MAELLDLIAAIGSLMALAVAAYAAWKIRRVHLKLFQMDRHLKRIRVQESTNLFRQIQALGVLNDTMDFQAPLPPLRDWAASPDFLVHLARHVAEHRPERIAECGSGASTVVLAHAARRNGRGHVFSLEDDPDYARQTEEHLAAHGLERWATVRVAPLEPVELEGDRYEWYARAAVDDLTDLDMVVVDGPHSGTNSQARFPAGPILLSRLRPGGAAFLDDAARPGETEVARRWSAMFPDLRLSHRASEKGCALFLKPETGQIINARAS